MIKKINELLEGNVVFVGGVSEYIHGIKNDFNDIDIVTPTPDKLLHIAPMFIYKNKKGKWARIKYEGNKNIDIWIKELPEYDMIDGLKFQTIQSMIEYYESIIEEGIEDKESIITKLKRLKK